MLEGIRAGTAPRFSVFETVKRMRPLAHALGFYHRETNLVHGDVKPANVIVTERPHHFVLIDFGSAWPVERTTRRERGDGETLPYAAPELLDSRRAADFRADIFSHSVMMYELLTNQISLIYPLAPSCRSRLGGRCFFVVVFNQFREEFPQLSARVGEKFAAPVGDAVVLSSLA